MTKSTTTHALAAIVLRLPFALLGAIGLVALCSWFIDSQSESVSAIRAYRSFTHPVWDFLFGWSFKSIDLSFPTFVKDYLTMGLIVSAAMIWMDSKIEQRISGSGRLLWLIPLYVVIWPLMFLVGLQTYWKFRGAVPPDADAPQSSSRNEQPYLDTCCSEETLQKLDPDWWDDATAYSEKTGALLFVEILSYASIIIVVSNLFLI